MKQKQIAKLNMFVEVSGMLTKNKKKWETILELNKSIHDFDTQKGELLKTKSDYEKDLTPTAENKVQKREVLINQVLPLANLLQIYTLDTKQKDISKKITISKGLLNKMKDSALVEKAETIWKLSKKLYNKTSKDNSEEKSISDYGVTMEMLEKLEKANSEFISSVLDLKDAVSHQKKCRDNFSTGIKSLESLLKKRIDKFMTLFELNDTTFYSQYKEARVIKPQEEETKEEPKVEKAVSNEIKPPPKRTTRSTASTRRQASESRKTNTTRSRSTSPTNKTATKTTPSTVDETKS